MSALHACYLEKDYSITLCVTGKASHKQEMASQPESALSLPAELNHNIWSYLEDDHRALMACSVVSRAFRSLTLPYLFHLLVIGFDSTRFRVETFRQRQTKRFLSLLKRGKPGVTNPHDESIELTFAYRLMASHPHIAGCIRSLNLYYKGPLNQELFRVGNTDALVLLELLRSLSSLHTLCMGGVILTPSSATSLLQTDYKRVAIDSLRMDAGRFATADQNLQLLALFDTIRELYVKVDCPLEDSSLIPFPQVNIIFLERRPGSFGLWCRMVAVRPSPQELEGFRVINLDGHSVTWLCTQLQSVGPFLNSLWINFGGIRMFVLFTVHGFLSHLFCLRFHSRLEPLELVLLSHRVHCHSHPRDQAFKLCVYGATHEAQQ